MLDALTVRKAGERLMELRHRIARSRPIVLAQPSDRRRPVGVSKRVPALGPEPPRRRSRA